MDCTLPTPGIILHVWPGQWALPSFDPLCLAAVLYLQLAIPGKFSLKECSNPDSSPTGQLPFLVHEQHVVASFASIVKYVSGFRNADPATYGNASLDSSLTPSEKSQGNAWNAHVESHLGDLVYHIFYANHKNWEEFTSPALASMFPVPQKYYVPQRIRDAYFPRLLAAGLWKEQLEAKPTAEPTFPRERIHSEKDKLAKKATFSQAFDREKVLEKARAELDIYKDLLDSKTFIFQDQPSSLDLLVAAHILLLLDPPLPDPLLKELIIDSYPSLESHARRLYHTVFARGRPLVTATPPACSLWAFLPSWPKNHHSGKLPSKEDTYYTQLRWGFVGLVLGSVAAYLAIVGGKVRTGWEPVERKDHWEVGEEKDELLEQSSVLA